MSFRRRATCRAPDDLGVVSQTDEVFWSFHGEISRMRHRRIPNGRDVTVAQNKTVALGQVGIFGVVLHYVKIQRGKNVRHAQGPPCARARCATRLSEHFYNRFPDVVCFESKCLYFRVGNHV